MVDLFGIDESERRGRADRRHAQNTALRPKVERRRMSRRSQVASAGLMAAAAFAGVHSYANRTGAPIGFESTGPSTVDVQEDNFRLPQYGREQLEPFIQEAAAAHGISANLVRAVVQTESQFNPMAVSPVGAKGLMQLMPGTAKHMGLADPFDPRQNVLAGTKYLSMMLSRFDGNTALALAGYNAGPENVRRYKGVPPFRETRGYVRKIQNLVADSDAAFSIPMPAKSKVRKASLRTSRRASVRSVAAKRSVVSKARVAKASSRAKVARARTSSAKVSSVRSKTAASKARVTRAKTTKAKSRSRGTRA